VRSAPKVVVALALVVAGGCGGDGADNSLNEPALTTTSVTPDSLNEPALTTTSVSPDSLNEPALTTTSVSPDSSRASASAPASSSPALADGAAVDIGGRTLFARCRGTEGPTILLEAGLNGDQRTWDGVLAAMSPELRVCAYDRANTGRSEGAPKPRTAQDVVDDLDALIEAIGDDPPFILVGFSVGGIFGDVGLDKPNLIRHN